MRIIYLTQSCPPEPGATLRPLKQASSLQALGHQVILVTTMPYYPHGRTFPGYRGRLVRHEIQDGVAIIRVWSLPTSNRGVVRRLLSYATFAVAAVMMGLVIEAPDLVIASVPNPGTDLAGIVLARLRGVPSIVELRDLVAESLPLIGISNRTVLARAVQSYTTKICRGADLIALPYEGMRTLLALKGIPRTKMMLLPHAADPPLPSCARAATDLRERLKLRNTFVAAYIGSLSAYYGLDIILDAAEQIQLQSVNVALLLVGTGTEHTRLEALALSRGLTNVVFAGGVSPDEVPPYLEVADMLIASISTTPYPVEGGYLYTKECQYLLAGKPVVVAEDVPRLGLLLNRIDAGCSVLPGDSKALAAAIMLHANDPDETRKRGQNARAFAEANLTRERVVGAFEAELRVRGVGRW